ncbi:phage baseplate assembly protein V [Selenomonas ruminantium]|uniref:phage baseplate assembly protein V n=1 Tax=Selenomonas ruminantium TaxID=971 RepID=UPI0003FF5D6D|nr:phage baseplate assembly protein V [Selenomonas ruminantium]
MAIDSHIKNFIRVGRVSVVFPNEMAVKVVFEDKDDLVSDKLPVLVQGSSKNKHFWLPDVGEPVVCLMLPNGHNAGICLGSYYSNQNPPAVSNSELRRLDFGDGSYIEFNRGTGGLTIQCKGPVVINGSTVNIN